MGGVLHAIDQDLPFNVLSVVVLITAVASLIVSREFVVSSSNVRP